MRLYVSDVKHQGQLGTRLTVNDHTGCTELLSDTLHRFDKCAAAIPELLRRLLVTRHEAEKELRLFYFLLCATKVVSGGTLRHRSAPASGFAYRRHQFSTVGLPPSLATR